MIFTLAAMHAHVGSQAPKTETPARKIAAFRVLDRGLPNGPAFVERVSPNGKAFLVRSGSLLYVVRGDATEQIPGVSAEMFFRVAIADNGAVLMNTQSTSADHVWGEHMRGVIYLNGEFRWFTADPNDPDQGAFEFVAFGNDGKVLGETRGLKRQGLEECDQVLVGRAQIATLFTNVFPNCTRTCAQIPGGYLCELPFEKYFRKLPRGPGALGSYVPAAAYRSYKGVPQWFEVPSNFAGSSISAWTPDGRTVAGWFLRGNGGGRSPLIWRDGKILTLLKVGKDPAYVWITGLDSAGDLGVGNGNGRGDGIPSLDTVAVIWREKEGLQTLADFAREQKIEIPKGWTLLDATSVSADGSFIIGTARGPDKRAVPFRLTIRSATDDQK